MTTQPTPPADTGWYNVYTGDATEEQVRAAYVKRHGTEPQRIMQLYGAGREWWAGPVAQPLESDGFPP